MSFLDNAPETGFLNSVEQLLARRAEVVEISTNAVEGLYVKLYKTGAYLAENALAEQQPRPEVITNQPMVGQTEGAPNNVVDLQAIKDAEEQQRIMGERARRDAEILHQQQRRTA